jgi:Pyrroline-5-carboxylate reductase dimerisation
LPARCRRSLLPSASQKYRPDERTYPAIRGIPRDLARRLVAHAMAGSAAWLQDRTEDATALRAKVTAPGGAGIQRIAQLDERGVLCSATRFSGLSSAMTRDPPAGLTARERARRRLRRTGSATQPN